MTEREPCDHPSATGDEGPNVRHVVRWRCDACDGIHYSDAALANLRAALAAQAEQNAELRAEVASHLDAARGFAAQANDAEAELSALRATDEYQRWARAVTERDAAREAVARVRALCDVALGAKPYPSAVSPFELRDALEGEPTANPPTLPTVPLSDDEHYRILDAIDRYDGTAAT